MAAWLILLVPPAGAASYTYAPQQRGDMVATMTVELADGTGLARVYYTLTVEGGPNLQVAPPELTDPAGAWKTHRSSAWTLTGGRATWVNNLAFDGSISVDTVITTVPTLIYTNNGGTNLVFSWSDPYNSFKLQSQTNSLKVGISNNWVNYPNGGTPPVTVPIVKTNPAVFFRIISIP